MLHKNLVPATNSKQYVDDMVTDIIYVSTLSEFSDNIRELMDIVNKSAVNMNEIWEEILSDAASRCLEDLYDTTAAQYTFVTEDAAVRLFLHSLNQEWEDNGLQLNIQSLLRIIGDNQKRIQCSETAQQSVTHVLQVLIEHTGFFQVLPEQDLLLLTFVDQRETYYCSHFAGSTPLIYNRIYHPIMIALIDNGTKTT